jgi:hypothetical protein
VRGWLLAGLILLGIILVCAFTALAGTGADHRGETVRTAGWADDVCGTTGAWRGQLKAVQEELTLNNFAGRRIDTSGDSQAENVYVRVALRRMISATEQTLQEGIARAGIPDAPDGGVASLTLRTWAANAERNLRAAKLALVHASNSPDREFTALGVAATSLGRVASEGQSAFAHVEALDPELATGLDRSGPCRRLFRETA